MKPEATVAQLLFIAAAAVGVYSFVSAAQKDARRSSCSALCKLGPAYAGENRTAPDFELPDMNGKLVRLSSFRGKIVYLNFWMWSCEPCRDELPSLAELAKIVQGRKDMVLLTVTTDDGPDAVRDKLKVLLGGDPPFPVLFDPDSNVVAGRYGTHQVPETWIIDPDGVIRARFDGGRDWSTALALEIGEMTRQPVGCPVEFFNSKARGPFAGLCDDDS